MLIALNFKRKIYDIYSWKNIIILILHVVLLLLCLILVLFIALTLLYNERTYKWKFIKLSRESSWKGISDISTSNTELLTFKLLHESVFWTAISACPSLEDELNDSYRLKFLVGSSWTLSIISNKFELTVEARYTQIHTEMWLVNQHCNQFWLDKCYNSIRLDCSIDSFRSSRLHIYETIRKYLKHLTGTGTGKPLLWFSTGEVLER